jgi:predicted AlkP superfamily pyrophosphatase or phosphodiesterase
MHQIIFVLFTIFVMIEARYPVLVVSFDGFRADKLQDFIRKNPNSSFARFQRNSTYSDYMEPSFPSSTFPNHFTLVTGKTIF